MTNEEKNTVFNVFHDGCIEKIEKISTGNFRLNISIEYLAETYKVGNNYFYLNLKGVKLIKLSDMSFSYLNKIGLDIISLRLKENIISVFGEYDYNIFDSLDIICEDIEIFSEEKKQISIEELIKIANKYWNDKK